MKPGEMKVLLTGATGGIGAELARRLVRGGASVLMAGRNEQKLDALCRELGAGGRTVESVAADLATGTGLREVANRAAAFGGGINVLINNAGINRFGLFESQSRDELQSVLVTNTLAPVLLTRELLPLLKRQDDALIVNVGSILGSIGLPGQVAYSTAKFALHGFNEALRRELIGSPVRTLYVAPRSTETDMNDALATAVSRKMGTATDQPSAVATQIFNAMTGGKRERFIGWPERLFVKLNALLPGIVDRSLQKQTRLLNEPQFENLTLDGVKQ